MRNRNGEKAYSVRPLNMKPLSILLITISTVLLTVTLSHADNTYDEHLLNDLGLILKQAQSHDDSIATLEAAAVMRVVDSSCYLNAVIASARPSSFRRRIRDCQMKHRDIWPEIERRIDYARTQCVTDPYSQVPDVRWELFIRYGQPTAEWSTPSDCAERGSGDCITYIYSWQHLDKQVTCQSDDGYPYPARIIEADMEAGDSRRLVYPIVQPLVFPSPDGTYDVWLSVWIRGGDFTKLSLLDGLTRFELRMKDAHDRVIGLDSMVADLRLLRSVLAVTTNKDAVMGMAYLNSPNLIPGRYTTELKIIASRMNQGTHKLDVVVPSRFAAADLSDPVLVTKHVPKGEEMQPGIVRGNSNFYANPLRVFRRNDSIDVYHEFLVPQSADGPSEFTITVTAYPKEKSRRRGRDEVAVSSIIYVQDTLGNPWGTKPQSGKLPPPAISQPEGTRRLYQETVEPIGNVHVFAHTLPLRTLGPDEYWLQIAITDKAEERFFRTALTGMRVK